MLAARRNSASKSDCILGEPSDLVLAELKPKTAEAPALGRRAAVARARSMLRVGMVSQGRIDAML